MFNKKKFPTKIFIIISIANLFFLGLVIIFLKANYSYRASSEGNSDNYRFFLKESISTGDPLVTKVPNLRDILAGPIISGYDPYFGPVEAEVIIFYFSDFKCEYCLEQEKVIRRLAQYYNNSEDSEHKVRVIWKDYPEYNQNSESFKSAVAARCAWKQGKFWEYHDLLYENSENLNEDVFIDLAAKIDLEKDYFVDCLKNNEIIGLVKDSIEEAQALDINGIPFIYINDQEVLGQASFEDLKRFIELSVK